MHVNMKSTSYGSYNKQFSSFYDSWAKNICFTITTVVETGWGSTLETYYRSEQPCYGELRRYAETHKKSCTAPEEKPSDLFDPFPYVGSVDLITAGYDKKNNEADDKKLLDFMNYLVKESPFSKGIKEGHVKTFNNKHVFFISGDSTPTVVVNLFINCGNGLISTAQINKFHFLTKMGMKKDMALFCLLFLGDGAEDMYDLHDCNFNPDNKFYSFCETNDYINTSYPSPSKFFSGKFNKLDHDGDTFRKGGNYSREHMAEVWQIDKIDWNKMSFADWMNSQLDRSQGKKMGEVMEKVKEILSRKTDTYDDYVGVEKKKNTKKKVKVEVQKELSTNLLDLEIA